MTTTTTTRTDRSPHAPRAQGKKIHAGSCGARTSRGACPCLAVASTGTTAGYPYCACGHTVQVHALVEQEATRV